MKKIFFALAAVVALASCANEETVMEAPKQAIEFGNVFVDNATRADYSSGNSVDAFKVYGTVKTTIATTQIFNGANVTRGEKIDGVAWDCDGGAQYWLPNATYNFAAIVDGEAAVTTLLPETINHVVADGTANKDLLYATATVTTDANAAPENGVNENGVVAFNFNHLLSKMQFVIKNETNQKYNVTSITVTGVAEDGVYTVGASTPWAKIGDDTTTLTFGTATVDGTTTVADASETRQILPVEQTLNVTITYDVMEGEQVIGTLTKTGTIEKTFEQNTVYVVTATISGAEINFSLGTVGDWGPSSDVQI